MEVTVGEIFPVLGNLDEEEISLLLRGIVTQLELTFWLNGSYLSQEDLQSKFNISPELLLHFEPQINQTLSEKRDLPKVHFLNSKTLKARVAEPDLDPYFVVACSLICDSNDKRSKAAKLKAVGISGRKFNSLLEDRGHKEFFKLRVEKAFEGTHEAAKLSLTRNVEAGDLQSIKYFHELTGTHDPNRETTVNLQKLILLFMEILVRHVDTKTVQAVSRDFDVTLLELGSGGRL